MAPEPNRSHLRVGVVPVDEVQTILRRVPLPILLIAVIPCVWMYAKCGAALYASLATGDPAEPADTDTMTSSAIAPRPTPSAVVPPAPNEHDDVKPLTASDALRQSSARSGAMTGTGGNSVVTPEDTSEPWNSSTTYGYDRHRREVEFHIVFLSAEHAWRYGDASHVEVGDGEVDLRAYLESEGFQSRVASDEWIIGVGSASVEGAPFEEENRALRRADKLVSLLRMTVTGEREFFALQLGKYEARGDEIARLRSGGTWAPALKGENTFDQRRVVIIGATAKTRGASLKEALVDALGRREGWPYNLGAFSKRELLPR